MKTTFAACLLIVSLVTPAWSQPPPKPVFISLAEAQPNLTAYRDALPKELLRATPLNEATWAKWVRESDQEMRKRLDRGQEDTLSNLLRFGVTFTKEYRIEDDYLPRYGESSLVNAFAENRANDLVRALESPHAREGFREMRAFIEKQGYSLRTPADRLRVKKYLLANLARLRDDFLEAHSVTARENRWEAFEKRGISLDTNLWPDYDIDAHLRAMVEQGRLKPGSIRRIAIIGPGLDFVNKQKGYDLYPPQTIQPFAVLDTLFRLKLADPATVELYTLDISSGVNLHIQRIRERAATGKPYVLELPWYAAGRWTEEFRRKFVSYWRNLGSKIGRPVPPVAVPPRAQGIEIRAIEVRPEVVRRVTPLDLNIVLQQLELAPEERFDLMIGTNVFIYYGAFEQSLVRANIATMLKPGGFLLSSERLADRVENGLAADLTTSIAMTGPPVMTDYIFCYRRN
jgi:hypothetical protein